MNNRRSKPVPGPTGGVENRVAHVSTYLQPGGGPAGYLYNLRRALESSELKYIIGVYAARQSAERRYNDGIRWIKSLARQVVPDVALRTLLMNRERRRWRGADVRTGSDVWRRARLVVFHDVLLARAYMATQRMPAQDIWIMVHGPVDRATEVTDSWNATYGQRDWSIERRRIAESELSTYEKAAGILVACKEAVDGYFTFDPDLRRRFQTLRFYELPTGAWPLKARGTQQEARARLNLPKNGLVVGFVGRYHPHKGYDIFQNMAAKAARYGMRDMIFVAAGAGPLERLRGLNNVIDLGWRQDVEDVLLALDVLVAPSRRSYFDLVLLEAMSLGKPIVASPVGGNCWLAQHCDGGMDLVHSSEASEFLNRVLTLAREGRLASMGLSNRSAYEKMFSVGAWLERHKEFASWALGRNG